jgi:uncharacterized membrane protein
MTQAKVQLLQTPAQTFHQNLTMTLHGTLVFACPSSLRSTERVQELAWRFRCSAIFALYLQQQNARRLHQSWDYRLNTE